MLKLSNLLKAESEFSVAEHFQPESLSTSQIKLPGSALQSTADLQADNNRCINNFLDILVIPFFISDLMITRGV